VPEICRFFGIVITMNYNEHNPPHFHARYGSAAALFTIDPIALYSGELPPRAIGLVMEWAAKHRAELRADWQLARNTKPLNRIAGLE
jgi:hypothetical protein